MLPVAKTSYNVLVRRINTSTKRYVTLKVLRKVFGSKRDEITRDWRRLHTLYSSSNVMGVIK